MGRVVTQHNFLRCCTDAVGFVQNLATTLMAAFGATLEEVAEADSLVHVVDASHPSMSRQIEAVEQVLEEIGAAGLLPPDAQLPLPTTAAALPSVCMSALRGTGIEDLLKCINENLLLQFVALDVLIPHNHGELVAQFHQFGTIERESYEAEGTHVRGYIPANHSGPFAAFACQREIPKRLRA